MLILASESYERNIAVILSCVLYNLLGKLNVCDELLHAKVMSSPATVIVTSTDSNSPIPSVTVSESPCPELFSGFNESYLYKFIILSGW